MITNTAFSHDIQTQTDRKLKIYVLPVQTLFTNITYRSLNSRADSLTRLLATMGHRPLSQIFHGHFINYLYVVGWLIRWLVDLLICLLVKSFVGSVSFLNQSIDLLTG